MELEELKNFWKEENTKLQNRIKLNESFLKKMNLDKSIGEFNKLLKISIIGRNLALVYCTISIVFAASAITEIMYSIPAIIGAFAMLWSFLSHQPIKKPDYSQLSVMELQKAIFKFRIHTATMAKYDISIVFLWFLTLFPLFLRQALNISIYSNQKYILLFCLFSIVYILLTAMLSRQVYQDYEQKLKQSEAYLEEVIEFENPQE